MQQNIVVIGLFTYVENLIEQGCLERFFIEYFKTTKLRQWSLVYGLRCFFQHRSLLRFSWTSFAFETKLSSHKNRVFRKGNKLRLQKPTGTCNLNLMLTPCTGSFRWSGESPIHTWLKRSPVQATMGAFLSFTWHWVSEVGKVQKAHDFYFKIYKLWKRMPSCLFVFGRALEAPRRRSACRLPTY